MQRLREIWRFWNWLPAFRAVAETEHLPTASEILGVPAPSLSRTIRQLEEELGRPLFNRRGRRLELNDAGERFLADVRDAMRLTYEGLRSMEDDALAGALCMSTPPLLARAIVLPVVEDLRTEHPGLTPHLYDHPTDQIVVRLLRGQIDVAFTHRPHVHRRLECKHLGALPRGVFARDDHPLCVRGDAPGPATLDGHEFVAYPGDGWPESADRVVRLRVDGPTAAVEACAQGPLLAVLPDLAVEAHGVALKRIRTPEVDPLPVHAVAPPTLREAGRIERLIDAVGARLQEAASASRDYKST